MLDIREFLTGGCINSHGHMHIHVRQGHGHSKTNVAETSVLEFHPLHLEEFQPLHLQHLSTSATSDEHDLERTLRLMRMLQSASRKASMRSLTIRSSQLPAMLFCAAPSCSHQEAAMIESIKASTPKKATLPDFDYGRKLAWDPKDPRALPSKWLRFSQHVAGSMMSNPHAQWQHCLHCNLRVLYVPRQSGKPHAESSPGHGAQDVGPLGSPAGGQEAYVGHLSGNDGEDQCRGEASCKDQPGDQAVRAQAEDQKECQGPCGRGSDPDRGLLHKEQPERQLGEHSDLTSRPIVSRGGRTSDHRGAQRADAHDSPTKDAGGSQHGVRGEPGTTLKRLPLHIGNKLLTFMTLMTTTLTMSSASRVLDGRDFLWEAACSENSWLTSEALRQGLPARRINYANGFDIYKPEPGKSSVNFNEFIGLARSG